MKRLLIFFCVMLPAVFMLISITDNYQSFAQSGCCKQRRTKDGRWYETDLNLEECLELNRGKDGDNVNRPNGRVWWDEEIGESTPSRDADNIDNPDVRGLSED
jgi:hypothetical protein